MINAISMETIKEVLDAGQEGLLPHMEITQMCVSRSRELAGYHMMTGLNPVHIISPAGKSRRQTPIRTGAEYKPGTPA